MKVKTLNKKDNKLIFEVSDASPELLNSLRRAAVYSVPVLAIEDIYFTENNSVLYDEQVAIRLGLIPLKTDVSKMKLPAECTCKGKGCKKCIVKVELKEKGPKMVLAKDLKLTGAENIYPEMPIVWLEENHEVDLKAGAVLGRGAEHAKWNTGWMFYSQEDNTFKVTLESWGQLDPKYILTKAAEIVKKELGELKL